MSALGQSLEQRVSERAAFLETDLLKRFWSQADRAFTVLLLIQWLAGIGLALWLTPRTCLTLVSGLSCACLDIPGGDFGAGPFRLTTTPCSTIGVFSERIPPFFPRGAFKKYPLF